MWVNLKKNRLVLFCDFYTFVYNLLLWVSLSLFLNKVIFLNSINDELVCIDSYCVKNWNNIIWFFYAFKKSIHPFQTTEQFNNLKYVRISVKIYHKSNIATRCEVPWKELLIYYILANTIKYNIYSLTSHSSRRSRTESWGTPAMALLPWNTILYLYKNM